MKLKVSNWQLKVAPLCLFVAFLLLLLVSLSLPRIKSIYLFELKVNASVGILKTGVSDTVRFGVWGYCNSGVDVEVLGHDEKPMKPSCSKAKLGYDLDSTLADILHIGSVAELISKALSDAMILHIISCVVTFAALLLSLFIERWSRDLARRPLSPGVRYSRTWFRYALAIAVVAALLATVISVIDYKFIGSVGNNIDHKFLHILTLSRGNAASMVVVAMIFLWASIFAFVHFHIYSAPSHVPSKQNGNDFPLGANYRYPW